MKLSKINLRQHEIKQNSRNHKYIHMKQKKKIKCKLNDPITKELIEKKYHQKQNKTRQKIDK